MMWIKALLGVAKTSFLCRRQLYQSINIKVLIKMTKAS